MATIRCQDHIFEGIQAVIFDKDGTLANVEDYLIALGQMRSHLISHQIPGIERSLLSALGLNQGELDPTGLLAVGSRYDNEVALAAYVTATGRGWIAALELVRLACRTAEIALSPKASQTPLLPGANLLLTKLKQAGVKIGIVSSDSHTEVAAFIAQHQLSDVDWYRGSSAETPPKTYPGSLQTACQRLAVSPSATLVIGDSAADLTLARQGAAGFLAMLGGWRQPLSINTVLTCISHLSEVECFN